MDHGQLNNTHEIFQVTSLGTGPSKNSIPYLRNDCPVDDLCMIVHHSNNANTQVCSKGIDIAWKIESKVKTSTSDF
jgi:hypothetical protein